MNAANQDGRRRSRVDAKVVELAAYRAGPGEPYVRVGTQADVAGAVALAKSRHEASRLGGLPWNAPKSAALFSSAVSADDRLLLIAVHDGEIVGSFLGMLVRSEEHTSELQSLMRISYAVFCLKKQKTTRIATRKSES